MKIINLSEKNSVLQHYLKEIRSVEIQKDSMRFRRNMERIGEIMAYEISKTLNYKADKVKTPLGIKETTKIVFSLSTIKILADIINDENRHIELCKKTLDKNEIAR